MMDPWEPATFDSIEVRFQEYHFCLLFHHWFQDVKATGKSSCLGSVQESRPFHDTTVSLVILHTLRLLLLDQQSFICENYCLHYYIQPLNTYFSDVIYRVQVLLQLSTP